MSRLWVKKITAHLSSTPTAKLLGMDSSRHCIHVSGRGNLEQYRDDVGGSRVVGCWLVCWLAGCDGSHLGGGFKYFSFPPLFGEDSHFD